MDGLSIDFERSRVSVRWLSGTILTGLCGAALMGGAVFAALDGEAHFAANAERVEFGVRAGLGNRATARKSDRLPPITDTNAARQVIRVTTMTKVGEREVKLSPKEYELLRVLVQHAGKVLTHRFLLKELWDELTDAQYLRVYVRQLRQKIEADPERPQFVLTETGIGYRLRAPD